MDKFEKNLRDAAAAFKKAFDEATAAGYRVQWPTTSAAIDSLAISTTDKVGAERGVVVMVPVTTGKGSAASQEGNPAVRTVALEDVEVKRGVAVAPSEDVPAVDPATGRPVKKS